MLSKAKGQILRVTATMHILFHLEKEDDEICDVILDDAIKAAINFIMTSIQHTAYMTGRSTVVQEVEIAESGKCVGTLTGCGGMWWLIKPINGIVCMSQH